MRIGLTSAVPETATLSIELRELSNAVGARFELACPLERTQGFRDLAVKPLLHPTFIYVGISGRTQTESNGHQRLRKPLFYPLNYGCSKLILAFGRGYSLVKLLS